MTTSFINTNILVLTTKDFVDKSQSSIHDFLISDLKPEILTEFQKAEMVVLKYTWVKILKSAI